MKLKCAISTHNPVFGSPAVDCFVIRICGRVNTSELSSKSLMFPPLNLGINSLYLVLYQVLQLLSSCTLVLG